MPPNNFNGSFMEENVTNLLVVLTDFFIHAGSWVKRFEVARKIACFARDCEYEMVKITANGEWKVSNPSFMCSLYELLLGK